MTRIRLKLLGAFALFDDKGVEVPVRGRKARAFLGFLALNPDQRHTREMLASFLWGDRFDTQARQSLRQALLTLRQLLGSYAPHVLQVDDEAILFKSAAFESDAREFEKHAETGDLEAASAVYDGDLLEGLSIRSEPFDQWINQERSRLRECACDVWERMAAAKLDHGDTTAAIGVAQRLTTYDPMRESGHRILMRTYAAAGRRTEALQHYQKLAATLQSELGVEPDSETTRLADDIRSGAGQMSGPHADEGLLASVAASRLPPRRWPWLAAGVVTAAAIVVVAIWYVYQVGTLSYESVTSRVTNTLAEKPSIAVLPFISMSDDPSQDYFADGMSEDIMTELSRFGYFFVISRNSTFSYKDTNTDVTTVAQDLDAQYVLEGSVRKVGDRIRVNVQLIDALADTHIWAEQYDRKLDDVFKVQDEIVASIVSSVAPEYLSAEMQRAQRQETPNFEAWDAYIRGYWHLQRFTRYDNLEARRLFLRAVELDPHRARYKAVLAVTYMLDGIYGWGQDREESFRTALEIAERGWALDDQDAQVIRALGLIHFFSRNYDAARGYYERAVTANPLEAENHALLGASLGIDGDYEAALAAFDNAFRLSPRDVHAASWYGYLAVAAFIVGHYEESVEWAQKAVQANPSFPGGPRTLAAAYGQIGRQAEAEAAREDLQNLLPQATIAQIRESIPYFREPDVLERYLEGLRIAGLPEQ